MTGNTLAERHVSKLYNDLIESRRLAVIRFAGFTNAGLKIRDGVAALVFSDGSSLDIDLEMRGIVPETSRMRRFQAILSYWLLFVFSFVLSGMVWYILYNASSVCEGSLR